MILSGRRNDQLQSNYLWSEAIAIDNDDSIENIHRQLNEKNTVGEKVTCGNMTVLKEPHSVYNALFGAKKGVLSPKNEYYLDLTIGY